MEDYLKDVDFEVLTRKCVEWIRGWFAANAPQGAPAVLGMSGGKDSTIAAALCAEALGKDRVIGVAMPSEGQSLNGADSICSYLGIRYLCVNVGETVNALSRSCGMPLSPQAEQNIPPRVRMATLYAISQTYGGRVVNTCNLSEDWIGYATRWGDSAGDFSPLGELTVQEVKAVGHCLGLPSEWVEKTPDDGLPHSCSDEQKIGFSYAVLDRYIRTGVCEDEDVRARIDRMHSAGAFKLSMPEKFLP